MIPCTLISSKITLRASFPCMQSGDGGGGVAVGVGETALSK